MRFTRRLALMLALVVPLASACGVRARAEGPSITVEQAWSRAAPQGRTGALFFTVTDAGAADRLVGVEAAIADKVELHETVSDNGVMKMRPVEALPVAPGKPLVLKPGGYHVMLVGLHRALNEGDSFPVTLRFAVAGAVTATAKVEKAGAASPTAQGAMNGMADMDHGGMDHSGMSQSQGAVRH